MYFVLGSLEYAQRGALLMSALVYLLILILWLLWRVITSSMLHLFLNPTA